MAAPLSLTAGRAAGRIGGGPLGAALRANAAAVQGALTPGFGAGANGVGGNSAGANGATAGNKGVHAKARAAAQDFEAVFLNSMFSEMFTGIGNEGPLGGGAGVGVWRSFLTEEYAKSFARAGGVGIADHVYRSLIATQEANQASAGQKAAISNQ